MDPIILGDGLDVGVLEFVNNPKPLPRGTFSKVAGEKCPGKRGLSIPTGHRGWKWPISVACWRGEGMTPGKQKQGPCQGPRGSEWVYGHQVPVSPADGWSLGQVQLEVQKKWRQWHLRESLLRPVALSSSSFSNGTSGLAHSTKASTLEPSRATYRASVI